MLKGVTPSARKNTPGWDSGLCISPEESAISARWKEESKLLSILWFLFVVLLVLWLVGFAVNWGSFLWLFLVAAIVVLLFNVFTGSRSGRWY
jgi:hypothetical protein